MLLLFILENWTVMDSIICLDISEAPKGSVTTQGLQVFQALLDLFPQRLFPRNAASEPHRIHPWSQGLTRVNWGHRQEEALEVTQWKI